MSSDFKLSVSKTKTFLNCKKQYEFSYILRLPKKERDYHILGVFAHKVLENYHNKCIEGCKDPLHQIMSSSFKDAYQEYKDKVSPEMKKDVFNIANQYLKIVSTEKDNVLSRQVIACEKNFSIKLKENVILNGMIDRVQIDDDNIIHVGDYKTTKNKKYLVNDFFQLLTYSYALALEDPSIKKVRASYILLRHNFECVTTEFSIDQIMEIGGKYIDYANKILEEKEFKPNPTVLCGWCDFLEVCDAGKQKTTKNNNKQTIGEINW